ncbi:MAG: DUF4922 domain-containing protein [Thermodesulfobacteriota bacterium]|nr:DUF4922 domain-containing protein [Thermodesulfobacteriota bacterium]
MSTVMKIIIRSWQKGDLASILAQKTYTTFEGGKSLKSLPGLCLDLLSEQKKAWSELQEGYGLLDGVREREVPCRGFSVRLQHNPGRIRSSLAVLSEKKGTDRPCFLCPDYLPEAQKGILYRRKYLILCNPMPVFPSHFTVSHLGHRLQIITEHIDIFLQLMADFGSGWTVLYNGPKCGASAPDHLHFQAAPSGWMPIEKQIREEKRLALMTEIDGVLFCRARDLGREVILLEGDDPMAVESAFKSFLDALKKLSLIDEEPMINIAGFYEERNLRLVIFPRRKHRPDAFFSEGDERVVVSPGVIDMGGVLITPVEKDFERLDGPAVESIYREVSLKGKIVEKAIDAMV